MSFSEGGDSKEGVVDTKAGRPSLAYIKERALGVAARARSVEEDEHPLSSYDVEVFISQLEEMRDGRDPEGLRKMDSYKGWKDEDFGTFAREIREAMRPSPEELQERATRIMAEFSKHRNDFYSEEDMARLKAAVKEQL